MVRNAKGAKDAAANNVARANELQDRFSRRPKSNSAPVGTGVEDEGKNGLDEGDAGHRHPTTFRQLRDGLTKKLQGDTRLSHIVDVTLKSSQAADCANELTMLALDKYEKQAELENGQRERQLLQSQARLKLDTQTARETLILRREELAASTAHQEKKDEQISELKGSVAAVHGTLADMGSFLKLLADRLPPANAST
ncbi:hypothetical protein DFH28DRAFT_918758 [Melampsora americana]|nr:hypothetical protein DFH28DRAFT_918758 [Melampsora americana]